MTFRSLDYSESAEVCSPTTAMMASPGYTSLPSPPTVVSDYNRPYDCVSSSDPNLIITEQPQSKFRFRYKSEMVGTHGQLKAERADRNKAIFPTVKLMNWTEGSALIRLALYTGEENTNLRVRHVHELSGKNCDKATGICEMVVDHTTDFTASFQNLGIIHIAKREVKEIIKQRKKSALIDHARLRRPDCSIEEIRQSITPTDMKKIEEEAEEVNRTMDLNKVVLRFQAFQYDENQRCYRAITRFVDSELVVNLKNASTGELKIVRMSECSAPCTGGTEVWMLVEKVKKSNIRIKFFELDNDGNEVWSAYGDFSEGDVHHQYAIIFRTPPYRSINLRSNVRVKVQLERVNDKDISEPRDFTYYPESRKRPSPFSESTRIEEDEDYPQGGGGSSKRHCQRTTEPLDLRFSEFSQVLPTSDSIYDGHQRDQYPNSSPSSYDEQFNRYSHVGNSQSHSSSYSSQGYQSNHSMLDSESEMFRQTRESNDVLNGSLYRSEYERQVAFREFCQKKQVKQLNAASSSSFKPLYRQQESEKLLSPNEIKYSSRRGSYGGMNTTDNKISPSITIRSQSCDYSESTSTNATNFVNLDSMVAYDHQQHSNTNQSYLNPHANLPSTSSDYMRFSSPNSSPNLSLATSPYHQPAVTERLLSVPAPHHELPINLSQRSQIFTPEANLDDGSSFLRRPVYYQSLNHADVKEINTPVPHSSTIGYQPNFWQDSPRESLHGNSPPTYTELQTVHHETKTSRHNNLNPLYIPPLSVTSVSSTTSIEPTSSEYTVPSDYNSGLTTPIVTVTPPAATSSPLSSVMWDNSDMI